MTTPTILDRLSNAEPPILSNTQSIVDADEEARLLEMILDAGGFATCPTGARRPAGAARWRRPVAGVAATIVVLGATSVALIATRSTHRLTTETPSTSSPNTTLQPSSATKATRTLTLADYRFTLPAGFEASHNSCVKIAVSGSAPHRSLGSAGTNRTTGGRANQTVHLPIAGDIPFAAAASVRGGCVEAVLVAGRHASVTITAGARPVQVGAYRGFLESKGGATEELAVIIPAADGDHLLVLIAQGLSGKQLIAVAESALPVATGLKTSCTSDCG